MSNKVTIREVAEAAGVGIGTVSRVLNNSPHVSDATREKVMAVINEFGFKPNTVARQLPRKANFQMIAVMTLPFNEYYSFAERLRGVQTVLQPHKDDYEVTLYNTHSFIDYDERLTNIIETSVMAGMIIIDLDLTKAQKEMLRNMNIPFVGLNHHHAEDWPCIGTDNVQGGYLAAKHLLDLGHRTIAYVGNELVDAAGFKTSQQRFDGFTRALEQAGLSVHPGHVKLGELDFDAAKAQTLELLNTDNPPTAIFAMSDTQALGVIAAVREAGLRVPDDVSVIGYDDVKFAYHVGLTTVRQHLELSGEVAMQYLLQLLDGRANPKKPELPALEVIQRNTTTHKR